MQIHILQEAEQWFMQAKNEETRPGTHCQPFGSTECGRVQKNPPHKPTYPKEYHYFICYTVEDIVYVKFKESNHDTRNKHDGGCADKSLLMA